MNDDSNCDGEGSPKHPRESPGTPPPSRGGLPLDLREQAGIVLALPGSGFYRHFLERFLERIGGLLHIPWWGVNLLFFLATALASVLLIDVPTAFGRGGYVSLVVGSTAEFVFTTWMLHQLREARAQGIVLAVRFRSAQDRLIWLRRYLAPSSWGWAFVASTSRRKEALTSNSETNQSLVTSAATTCAGEVRCLKVWQVVLLALAVFYVAELPFYDLISGTENVWQDYTAHLVWIYTHTAKAAMMVAVLSHFWWLAGVMAVVRGIYPSVLSSTQRLSLYAESRQAALRLSAVVGLSAGIWAFNHGWAFGVTAWSYLLSLGLAVIFTTQTVIMRGLKPRPFDRTASLPLSLDSLIKAVRDLTRIYRPVEMYAALSSIACPIALNFAGAFAVNLWAK